MPQPAPSPIPRRAGKGGLQAEVGLHGQCPRSARCSRKPKHPGHCKSRIGPPGAAACGAVKEGHPRHASAPVTAAVPTGRTAVSPQVPVAVANRLGSGPSANAPLTAGLGAMNETSPTNDPSASVVTSKVKPTRNDRLNVNPDASVATKLSKRKRTPTPKAASKATADAAKASAKATNGADTAKEQTKAMAPPTQPNSLLHLELQPAAVPVLAQARREGQPGVKLEVIFETPKARAQPLLLSAPQSIVPLKRAVIVKPAELPDVWVTVKLSDGLEVKMRSSTVGNDHTCAAEMEMETGAGVGVGVGKDTDTDKDKDMDMDMDTEGSIDQLPAEIEAWLNRNNSYYNYGKGPDGCDPHPPYTTARYNSVTCQAGSTRSTPAHPAAALVAGQLYQPGQFRSKRPVLLTNALDESDTRVYGSAALASRAIGISESYFSNSRNGKKPVEDRTSAGGQKWFITDLPMAPTPGQGQPAVATAPAIKANLATAEKLRQGLKRGAKGKLKERPAEVHGEKHKETHKGKPDEMYTERLKEKLKEEPKEMRKEKAAGRRKENPLSDKRLPKPDKDKGPKLGREKRRGLDSCRSTDTHTRPIMAGRKGRAGGPVDESDFPRGLYDLSKKAFGAKRPVLVTSADDNSLQYVFESGNAAATFIGTSESALSNGKRTKAVLNGWLASSLPPGMIEKEREDNEREPEPEARVGGTRPVWLTNVEDSNNRLMFNTAKKASDFIDVSQSTLCHARNTDKALNGWYVTDAKNEPGSAVASSPLANRGIKTQRHKKDERRRKLSSLSSTMSSHSSEDPTRKRKVSTVSVSSSNGREKGAAPASKKKLKQKDKQPKTKVRAGTKESCPALAEDATLVFESPVWGRADAAQGNGVALFSDAADAVGTGCADDTVVASPRGRGKSKAHGKGKGQGQGKSKGKRKGKGNAKPASAGKAAVASKAACGHTIVVSTKSSEQMQTATAGGAAGGAAADKVHVSAASYGDDGNTGGAESTADSHVLPTPEAGMLASMMEASTTAQPSFYDNYMPMANTAHGPIDAARSGAPPRCRVPRARTSVHASHLCFGDVAQAWFDQPAI